MRLSSSLLSLPLAAMALVACNARPVDNGGEGEGEGEGEGPVVEAKLFAGTAIDTIADEQDGLDGPRDLDFNPDVPGELWILNRNDDGAVTIRDVGTEAQTSLYRKDPYAMHFMEETSSMSFAKGGKFGTCGESRNTYDDRERPNDFMGPALWSASDDIFAISNPEAVEDNNFDLGSHLDMMHETPLCMGIAWVETGVGDDNVYFVFEGLTSTIARYDFRSDHGPGFDYHGDGTVERFIDVDVKRVANVPSHIVYHYASDLLYVADTGNKRIGVLDTLPAEKASEFEGSETPVQRLEGASWTSLPLTGDIALEAPSGLAIKDEILYVGDNGTTKVHAFDLDGNHLDTLDLSGEIAAGGLMGLRVNPEGDSLYVVDNVGSKVLRIKGLNVPK